jgi:hypothetical protein
MTATPFTQTRQNRSRQGRPHPTLLIVSAPAAIPAVTAPQLVHCGAHEEELLKAHPGSVAVVKTRRDGHRQRYWTKPDGHFWITPKGESVRLKGTHAGFLSRRRDLLKRFVPEYDGGQVEDHHITKFAQRTGWVRARHWNMAGHNWHSYSLPNERPDTFEAAQRHHEERYGKDGDPPLVTVELDNDAIDLHPDAGQSWHRSYRQMKRLHGMGMEWGQPLFKATALHPKSDYVPGEDCPHCGASMEQGGQADYDKTQMPLCNSCGKEWPDPTWSSPSLSGDGGQGWHCPWCSEVNCSETPETNRSCYKCKKTVDVIDEGDSPSGKEIWHVHPARQHAGKDGEDIAKAFASGYPLQGRRMFRGLHVSIENRKGRYRVDKQHDPPQWKSLMYCDYGYVRGSEGVDGDHIDVFVGPNENAPDVYIVRQVNPSTGKFDEQKCMLGFDSAEQAKAMYLKHYDTPKFFGGITAMPFDEFKAKSLASLHGEKLLKAVALRALSPAPSTATKKKNKAAAPGAKPTAPRQIAVVIPSVKPAAAKGATKGALTGARRVGGVGPSHKGSKWITVHDAVEVHVPRKGRQSGAVVSATKNHVWVFTRHGTFEAPRAEVTPLKRKVTFDWRKASQVIPHPGSVVTVRPLPESLPAGMKQAQSVKRVLAEPIKNKGANASVKVLEVRPGRNDMKTHTVKRSQIAGPYLPDKFIDPVEKTRTRRRPDAVKTKSQLKSEASNLTYVKYLDARGQKNLSERENKWFAKHEQRIEGVARGIAARMMITGENVQDLISHANVGALYAYRQWDRDRAAQRGMKLSNMARHAAIEAGLDLDSEEGKAFVKVEAHRLSKTMSATALRDKHIFAGAWMETMRRADEVMDITGLSGINRSDIGRVVRAERDLSAELGRRPLPRDIANRLGWTSAGGEEKVRLCLAKKIARAASRMSELERETEGGTVSPQDTLAAKPEVDAASSERAEQTRAAVMQLGRLAGLDERQTLILREGLSRDIANRPKASGAALAIAQQLRKEFGGKDSEGSVIQEWTAIQQHLSSYVQGNRFTAEKVLGQKLVGT